MISGSLADAATVVEHPWGIAAIADLYVGIALFSGWVVARERRLWRAGLWIAGLVALGNLLACVYVLRAWHEAKGDGMRFWRGER